MTMAVVRNGTGPVHIAYVDPGQYEAICGRTLSGANVRVFRKGKPAVTIWLNWRHCAGCESEDRRMSRPGQDMTSKLRRKGLLR